MYFVFELGKYTGTLLVTLAHHKATPLESALLEIKVLSLQTQRLNLAIHHRRVEHTHSIADLRCARAEADTAPDRGEDRSEAKPARQRSEYAPVDPDVGSHHCVMIVEFDFVGARGQQLGPVVAD